MSKGVTPVMATVLVIGLSFAAVGGYIGFLKTGLENTEGKSDAQKINFEASDLKKESCYRDSTGVNLVLKNQGSKALNSSKISVLTGGVPTDDYTFNKEVLEKSEVATVNIKEIVEKKERIKLFTGEKSKEFSCLSTEHPKSCNTINEKGNSRGDGYYFIDPGSEGPGFKAYCKMKPDGGWTLIGSYVDGSFFDECSGLLEHGSSCYTSCREFTEDSGDCDTSSEKEIQDEEIERLESKYVINSEKGKVDSFKSSDYVSPAYYRMEFQKTKFRNDQNEYINYDFSSYTTQSMSEFYQNVDTTHLETIISYSDSNLDPNTINFCDNFDLAIMSADEDSTGPSDPIDYTESSERFNIYAPARAGPAWDAGLDDGCKFDDQRGWWGRKRLGGSSNEYSSYISWYVK